MLSTLLATAALAAAPAAAPATPDLGPNLERFAYPHPVRRFAATPQGEPVTMAYMDIAPTAPANGHTVLLLHGKNFCAATWGATADALAAKGYRVIAPDQIGFCKSSKPAGFQYSFAALSNLTDALLADRGLGKVDVVGHSMGGMLAVRFALLHPTRVDRLILVNPLGLADRIAQGVPPATLTQLIAEETRSSATSIKAYQQANYYHGTWRPEYDKWVAMSAGMSAGPGRAIVANAQARTSDMIQTQPIAYELDRLRVPTTLMIGMRDTTAFGRARAPAAIRASIPAIPALADATVRRIPGARLVKFDALGHSPQVEDPATFQAALLAALAR
ncbi:alpha/beta fold hydrolase [Sphingomonas prati]|uniref:Pimeloyl-ACP methyl ester carboxylesterase n=1 Tax=Sphingomonas prati TaxID=1843237 RepID=A0A7W9F260_9SPHN|nr:alpha/beta hydrolase [Sphingomonas prati]MBB5728150.1 pimeloyl-ACP methyl ester carboxylesterase [Sphingomonas prati]GGE83658.1 alpha/beta hydrolase [Sphingomonas prati]